MGNTSSRGSRKFLDADINWQDYYEAEWRSESARELDRHGGPSRPPVARGDSVTAKLVFLEGALKHEQRRMKHVLQVMDDEVQKREQQVAQRVQPERLPDFILNTDVRAYERVHEPNEQPEVEGNGTDSGAGSFQQQQQQQRDFSLLAKDPELRRKMMEQRKKMLEYGKRVNVIRGAPGIKPLNLPAIKSKVAASWKPEEGSGQGEEGEGAAGDGLWAPPQPAEWRLRMHAARRRLVLLVWAVARWQVALSRRPGPKRLPRVNSFSYFIPEVLGPEAKRFVEEATVVAKIKADAVKVQDPGALESGLERIPLDGLSPPHPHHHHHHHHMPTARQSHGDGGGGGAETPERLRKGRASLRRGASDSGVSGAMPAAAAAAVAAVDAETAGGAGGGATEAGSSGGGGAVARPKRRPELRRSSSGKCSCSSLPDSSMPGHASDVEAYAPPPRRIYSSRVGGGGGAPPRLPVIGGGRRSSPSCAAATTAAGIDIPSPPLAPRQPRGKASRISSASAYQQHPLPSRTSRRQSDSSLAMAAAPPPAAAATGGGAASSLLERRTAAVRAAGGRARASDCGMRGQGDLSDVGGGGGGGGALPSPRRSDNGSRQQQLVRPAPPPPQPDSPSGAGGFLPRISSGGSAASLPAAAASKPMTLGQARRLALLAEANSLAAAAAAASGGLGCSGAEEGGVRAGGGGGGGSACSSACSPSRLGPLRLGSGPGVPVGGSGAARSPDKAAVGGGSILDALCQSRDGAPGGGGGGSSSGGLSSCPSVGGLPLAAGGMRELREALALANGGAGVGPAVVAVLGGGVGGGALSPLGSPGMRARVADLDPALTSAHNPLAAATPSSPAAAAVAAPLCPHGPFGLPPTASPPAADPSAAADVCAPALSSPARPPAPSPLPGPLPASGAASPTPLPHRPLDLHPAAAPTSVGGAARACSRPVSPTAAPIPVASPLPSPLRPLPSPAAAAAAHPVATAAGPMSIGLMSNSLSSCTALSSTALSSAPSSIMALSSTASASPASSSTTAISTFSFSTAVETAAVQHAAVHSTAAGLPPLPPPSIKPPLGPTGAAERVRSGRSASASSSANPPPSLPPGPPLTPAAAAPSAAAAATLVAGCAPPPPVLDAEAAARLAKAQQLMAMYANRVNAMWAQAQQWAPPAVLSIPEQEAFCASDAWVPYKVTVLRMLKAGSLGVHIDACADAVQLPDGTSVDLWTSDPWVLAQRLRPGSLPMSERIEGMSLGARALQQLVLAVEGLAGREAVGQLTVVLAINDDQRNAVVADIRRARAYGLKPENLVLTAQRKRCGYRYDPGAQAFLEDPSTPAEVLGSGYALCQLAWLGDAFWVTRDGELSMLMGRTLLERFAAGGETRAGGTRGSGPGSGKGGAGPVGRGGSGPPRVEWLVCRRARDLALLTSEGVLDLQHLAFGLYAADRHNGNMVVQAAPTSALTIPRAYDSTLLTLKAAPQAGGSTSAAAAPAASTRIASVAASAAGVEGGGGAAGVVELRAAELSSPVMVEALAAVRRGAAAAAGPEGGSWVGLQRCLLHVPTLHALLNTFGVFRPKLAMAGDVARLSLDAADIMADRRVAAVAVHSRTSPAILNGPHEVDDLIPLLLAQDRSAAFRDILSDSNEAAADAAAASASAGGDATSASSASPSTVLLSSKPGIRMLLFIAANEVTQLAVNLVLLMARPGRDVVHLVTVVHNSLQMPTGQALLLKFLKQISNAMIEAHSEVLVKSGSGLLEVMEGAAARLAPQLVVMGSAALTLAHLNTAAVMGSVTLSVLKRLTVPVAVATSNSKNLVLTQRRTALRCMVLVDSTSRPVLSFLCGCCMEPLRGDKLLLAGHHPTRQMTSQQQQTQRRLIDNFGDLASRHRFHTPAKLQLDGLVDKALAAAAEEEAAHLVGVQVPLGSRGLPGHVLGLIRGCRAAVLVFRDTAAAAATASAGGAAGTLTGSGTAAAAP